MRTLTEEGKDASLDSRLNTVTEKAEDESKAARMGRPRFPLACGMLLRKGLEDIDVHWEKEGLTYADEDNILDWLGHVQRVLHVNILFRCRVVGKTEGNGEHYI